MSGGLAPQHVSYTVTGCNAFSQESPLTESGCENQLPLCEPQDGPFRVGEQTPRDLNELLANADVEEALATAPVTYGVDARPVDGEAFVLTIDGDEIVLGDECPEGDTDCVPVPSGVQVLRQALAQIVMQQVDWEACGQEPFCWEDADSGPCEAAIPRWFFNYETHRCEEFSYGGCDGNENNFESFADCQLTCYGDPCSYGTPYDTPDDCDPASIVAGGYCFETVGMACECACYEDGGSLDDCEVLENVPAGASCVSDG